MDLDKSYRLELGHVPELIVVNKTYLDGECSAKYFAQYAANVCCNIYTAFPLHDYFVINVFKEDREQISADVTAVVRSFNERHGKDLRVIKVLSDSPESADEDMMVLHIVQKAYGVLRAAKQDCPDYQIPYDLFSARSLKPALALLELKRSLKNTSDGYKQVGEAAARTVLQLHRENPRMTHWGYHHVCMFHLPDFLEGVNETLEGTDLCAMPIYFGGKTTLYSTVDFKLKTEVTKAD